MIKDDPAIEEIRETRRRISEEFGHDTRALVEHYRELEKRHADRILPVAVVSGRTAAKSASDNSSR